MHRHHPIAKSRGGEDNYTVCLDPYTHCYDHAVDFLLFENAPRFDFRHKAWPLMPQDLRAKVLEKVAEMGKAHNYLTDKGRRQGGITKGKRDVEQKTGLCGRTPEEMSQHGRKGGKLGGKTQGDRNAQNKTGFCNPEVQSRNAQKLNSKKVRCTVTGHISTPGGLSRFQQGRGIDHKNPLNREAV